MAAEGMGNWGRLPSSAGGRPPHLNRQFVLNPTDGQKDMSKRKSSGGACVEKQMDLLAEF